MNMPMVTEGRNRNHAGPALAGFAAARRARPEWATGLRQIYDSVLHEPLPESVRDLLARLDKG